MYCKRCGTPLHTGVMICPECGARQRRQASSVRCASCHGRVPLSLSVCPHCGREVRPAGPRWGFWLAAVIAMVVMVLWGLGRLPVERIGQDIVGIRATISGLVQVLGPMPTAGQPAGTPQLLARITPEAPPMMTADENSPLVAPQAEPAIDSEEAEALISELPPIEPGLVAEVEPPAVDTQTVTDAPSLTPTASPTASPTAMPTATPTLPPTPTATLAPPTATVPPPSATAAPAAGSSANKYRIKSGDTLSGISQMFNVSLEALLAANRIAVNATLRIGQELMIPGAGAPLPPTATPRPRSTPTPAPRPTLPATLPPYLPVPVQFGPGDQASYRGDKEQIYLIWDAVPGVTADERYQVVIRWVEQGALQEKSDLFTTATSIQVPPWLWGRADQPERRYQWFVRAVRLTTDGQGGELVIPLSPVSPTRTFYWN